MNFGLRYKILLTELIELARKEMFEKYIFVQNNCIYFLFKRFPYIGSLQVTSLIFFNFIKKQIIKFQRNHEDIQGM